MNAILADVFALYLKTKNFHWHMSGPHFRDYHLLLDEHGDQLFAMTDPIAERIRKIVDIYYKDWGKGQPIVFSHGWPLSADDWDTQMLFFLSKGYRVIAHDRRGHGRSTQTGDGHDMDHYADDLRP
jgi:alpha-beta hydrolase superfamily lysophospholipase